ncbi:hypothetical protein [Halopiger djelfimassiliensis]|uniref:hypothetical protein n=1 Tax=Halopiger djelfimassiliensis TaxID=1293047 RepID=UPI00067791E9|nr:hypothetical protein [Halopiger djelfimassiliensis]
MNIDIVDELQQPEYTGENRCVPCTVLNLVIAAVLGSVIARKSKLGGVLAVGLSVALIYLRGYLVPGTPTLTKRYLPPEVLRWFGKEPEPDVASGLGAVDSSADASAGLSSADDAPEPVTVDEPTATDGHGTATDDAAASADTEPDPNAGSVDAIDLEAYFLEHDVLEPCEESDDLCLTESFETAWLEEIDPLAESGVDAAAAIDAFGFDADPESFDIGARDDVRVLRSDSAVAGRWPSRAALVADVAASRTLAEWVDDWDTYDPEAKGQILNSLRMFLETCPTDGGSVSIDEEVVESCCSSHEVFAVTCDETGERLFEQPLTDV